MRLFLALLIFLFVMMFWVNKKQIYKAAYVVLNLVLITIVFNFFILFTSFMEISPWHESGGVQILVPIYMAIWLCIIGGLLMLLSINIPISNAQQYTPFAAGIVLGAIVLYEAPESLYIQIIGAVISITLFAGFIYLFTVNFEKVFTPPKKQKNKIS